MGKKVHLVLGSGGARGMAHLAVIDMLLADGHQILDVVGCSMGAVVGGMYCAGYLGAYRDWLLAQTKSDIYRLLDIAFSTAGLVKGERIFGALKQITGDLQIEKLGTPFMAVATDLLTRTEVHFESGDLHEALRASTGIPGMFTPMALRRHLFVDGGVLNPLPIDLVRRQEGALIVAVNLNGEPVRKVADAAFTDHPESSAEVSHLEASHPEVLPKAHRYFSRTDIDHELDSIPDAAALGFSMFELLNASYDATLDRLVELTLELRRPDVLIEIPRDVCRIFDFHRAAEVFEAGKAAYRAAHWPESAEVGPAAVALPS